MNTIQWSDKLEKHLQNQVVTIEQPGPVLKDFTLILDYVGIKGVKSAGKYSLLPIRCIPELGPRLSRSFTLDLKRPQLRSHPYLQGLNLLLRASGLGRVDGTGAKARLAVDPMMLEQWNLLNPIEQYFNLLEAWLRLGRAEMVGDHDRFRSAMLMSCIQTWRFLSENARILESGESQYLYFVGIDRAYYQLALLDLFGILVVGQPSGVRSSWIPTSLETTPFGDALLSLLDLKIEPISGYVLMDDDEEEEEEDEGESEAEEDTGLDEPWLGAWQSILQPYFPEWQENLVFPKREPREGTHLFKVSLGSIWRRIAMPADATLDDLVGMILRSMKFDFDHMYQFTYKNQFGLTDTVSDPRINDGPWADQVPLRTFPLAPGQTMQLRYDFGDSWDFIVLLEQIEPPDPKVKVPRIVESHGQAPKQYSWDE